MDESEKRMKKIVAFVPLKMNNERCPGKNTRVMKNGRTLLDYILSTLSEIKEISDIFVYCSDEQVVKLLPGQVSFLKRDPYYDLSTTSFNEVLESFANLVSSDIYVLAHATAPFISADSIRRAINSVDSGLYDSAFSVVREQDFLWKNGKPLNYDPENIPRTQDLEVIYKETCGLYVYERDLIMSKNRRIGYRPALIEVNKIEACDVNDEEDFYMIECIAQRKMGGGKQELL